MAEYKWRKVWRRCGIAMLCAIFLIVLLAFGRGYILFERRFAPCPNADWHFVTSFFVAFFCALVFIESVNWVVWFRMHDLAPESGKFGGSFPAPEGWIGAGLSLTLLILAYVLRSPHVCDSFDFNTISLRDCGGILALAYGLLVLIQA